MDPGRIAALLAPYNDALDSAQLAQVAAYLDLLLRWNARTNLTAVRDPENIVSRHFGESLFAARLLLPMQAAAPDPPLPRSPDSPIAFDLGSGAGFPGLPLKIWAPQVQLTLIESQNKKATFLREVVRALKLHHAAVYNDRAETIHQAADLVTMRAVEKFSSAMPLAVRLLRPGGRLALLIGQDQVEHARTLAPGLEWSEAAAIPLSEARVLLVGRNHAGHVTQP